MSPQRNTPTSMPRRRHTIVAAAAILTPVVAGLAACSTDAPTSPAAVRASAAGVAAHAAAQPHFDENQDDNQQDQGDQEDTKNRMSRDSLNAKAATWHTQRSDVEAGTDRPLPLMCGISGSYTVSKAIGPAGGQLTFGKSALVVPKGALSATTQITANIVLGAGVQVTFFPHGLQFNKPVQIVANYAGCTMPAGGAMNVYYLNDSGGIMQSMPSSHDATAKQVTALTDHFSGYTLAWGRSAMY